VPRIFNIKFLRVPLGQGDKPLVLVALRLPLTACCKLVPHFTILTHNSMLAAALRSKKNEGLIDHAQLHGH